MPLQSPCLQYRVLSLGQGSCLSSGSLLSSCVAALFLASSKSLYFLLLFFTALLFLFCLVSPITATLLFGPFSLSSSLSASICLAILRFCVLERVACTLRTKPVGICFNCTAEEVLFWGICQAPRKGGDFCAATDVSCWSPTYNLLTPRAAAFQERLCEFMFVDCWWPIRHFLRTC